MNDLIIRKENQEDYYSVEYMTKKAFWNLHVPGCNEHYLVNILRKSDDYIPELSRVAEKDGAIVGAIMYSKAYIIDNDEKHEILSFGPLCVDPEYQDKGIGSQLVKSTMKMAKELGYKGIIIFGEPGYYPKHGFKTCDRFAITTSEGKNFDAFMGIELVEGAFDNIKGKFYESDVFEKLNEDDVNEFDKKFPWVEKLKLPGQWDNL